jgi:hypothetical protein
MCGKIHFPFPSPSMAQTRDVLTLLVNARTLGKVGVHTTVGNQNDRDYASGATHPHGVGDCLLCINQQSLSWRGLWWTPQDALTWQRPFRGCHPRAPLRRDPTPSCAACPAPVARCRVPPGCRPRRRAGAAPRADTPAPRVLRGQRRGGAKRSFEFPIGPPVFMRLVTKEQAVALPL